MEALLWKCLAFIALCSLAFAVPVPENSFDELSPVAAEVSII